MPGGYIGDQPRAIHDAHGQRFDFEDHEDAYNVALASAAAAVGSSEIKVATLLAQTHETGIRFSLLVGTDEAYISVDFGEGVDDDRIVAIMRSWAAIDRIDVRATEVEQDVAEARLVSISIRDSPESGFAHELRSSRVPREQIAQWLDLARAKLRSR